MAIFSLNLQYNALPQPPTSYDLGQGPNSGHIETTITDASNPHWPINSQRRLYAKDTHGRREKIEQTLSISLYREEREIPKALFPNRVFTYTPSRCGSQLFFSGFKERASTLKS